MNRRLIVVTALVGLVSTSWGQRPPRKEEPADAAGVATGFKEDDALGRIMAIRKCETLGEEARDLMPALVELLWDERTVAVPDMTVGGRHGEKVSERARAAFWVLGATGAPALSTVLHGKDGERASLAGKVLQEALLGKSYDRPRTHIDGGSGIGSSRTPGNKPKEPAPAINYATLPPAVRALERARFEIWAGTLRDEKMVHGKRPGDGVAMLSVDLDAYFVAFAPYVTPEKLQTTKEGEEWKVLLEAVRPGGEVAPAKRDIGLQIKAARLLGEAGGTAALPQMFDLLETADIYVGEALRGEIAAQGAAAVDGLFAKVLDEKSHARMAAMLALRQITDKQAVPILLGYLKDPRAKARQNAAESLGHFKDSRALEPLIEMLQKDEDAGARSSAAIGLEQIDDPKMRVGAALIEAVKGDKDKIVRWRSVISLDRMPATWDAALETLQAAAANDSEAQVREEATRLLAKIKAEKPRQNPAPPPSP